MDEFDALEHEALYPTHIEQQKMQKQLEKWRGTGLEDDVYQEYLNPTKPTKVISGPQYPKEKEPLF
jgi:hypothetical protein